MFKICRIYDKLLPINIKTLSQITEILKDQFSLISDDEIFRLPDNPALCRDPAILEKNKRRLKFYEQYGARSVINTKYETRMKPEDDNPPYLVFDGSGTDIKISGPMLKIIIMAVPERKYSGKCSLSYVEMAINSVSFDQVRLRPFRYKKKPGEKTVTMCVPDNNMIFLVFNNQHEIHHVKEKGHVEAPVKVNSILKHLSRSNLFRQIPALPFSEKHITSVHDIILVHFYKNAFLAARNAVNCALTCARKIIEGCQLAYALVRLPGHHAERRVFGGLLLPTLVVQEGG